MDYTKATREEMKQEAIKRMKALGVYPETIKQFEKENLISISEPPVGAFFWVEGDDLEYIRAIEERFGGMAYCAIRSYTEFGTLDSFLWVSDAKEEWGYDWEDIPDNYVFCYVRNREADFCSEFGTIAVRKTIAAGLQRIG